MAKKKKGFFSAVGSFLGSIPAVGKVKKAAKKATKKAKKAVKSAKKKIKAKKKKLKAKVKKAAKKLKKKAKKKIGKVFTKARKIKNNLSKSKMVKKVKKAMKKAVLTTKKAAKKVKKAAKTAVKVVKKVAKKAVVAAKNMDLKQAISTAADFIPVVSNAKAIYEAAVGKDPFTGRKLEAWERGASAASILGGPIVKGIKHGGKAVVGIVKNGSKSTKKTTAATKPKDTTPPSQKKQENKPKPNTTPAPAGNKKQTTSTAQNDKKPAEVKQQGNIADNIVVDKYGVLKKSKTIRGQAHHLNQDAAYREKIPTKEGMSTKLEGNAFKDVDSPHYNAHESLEQFWNQFRPGGDRYGDIPTNLEYTKAMVDSLKASGFTKEQAMQIAKEGVKQRIEYGLLGGEPVPKIPGKINQKKR